MVCSSGPASMDDDAGGTALDAVNELDDAVTTDCDDDDVVVACGTGTSRQRLTR